MQSSIGKIYLIQTKKNRANFDIFQAKNSENQQVFFAIPLSLRL